MSAVAEHKPRSQEVQIANDRPESQIMPLIAQAVRDGAPMEMIRELRQMMKEDAKELAEAEFNKAMRAAQAEIGPIAANQDNSQTKSRYADYYALDKVLRPIYTKHGFSVSFNQGDDAPEGHVKVVAYVSHEAGHTRTYRADMPNDGKGAKGGDVMTKTHASGAAMSYGMRYLSKMIWNVAVGEDDTDGNTPLDTITADQAADLQATIEDVGQNKADAERLKSELLRWAGIAKLSDLPASKLTAAIQGLNTRRGK